jgi:hypothetical protein
MRDTTGNLPPLPGVFPDYMAPIVRNAPDGMRELTKARWGMPSSQFALMLSVKKRAAKLEAKGQKVDFKEMLRMEPDSRTTNIRKCQQALAALVGDRVRAALGRRIGGKRRAELQPTDIFISDEYRHTSAATGQRAGAQGCRHARQ